LICSREGDTTFTLDKEEEDADYSKELVDIYGEKLTPSDIAFVYEEWEYGEETAEEKKDTSQGVKDATAEAYDQVGASAHHEGNLEKAYKVMSRLGYSTEEFKIAGNDAYNF
jgi:hypothetical protein